MKYLKYAKAIVAVIGITVTVLLGVIPQGTPTWNILTAVAGLLTALGVHQVPNATDPVVPADPPADPTVVS